MIDGFSGLVTCMRSSAARQCAAETAGGQIVTCCTLCRQRSSLVGGGHMTAEPRLVEFEVRRTHLARPVSATTGEGKRTS